MKLSNRVVRRYQEIISLDNEWEVETDIGWVDIEKLMLTEEYQVYAIMTKNRAIKCADKHILIDEFDNEIYAIDSKGVNIKTVDGIERVESIIDLGYKESMYDLQLAEHHKFYTNGMLSHNTTVVGGYLLHLAVFRKSYTIACLANKRDQAQEILGRIQLMYERLPWFLQMGVKVWNKGNIELGNGTKVFIAATSGSAVRGRSLNCFGPNTPLTVQNKNTLGIKTVQMHELEKELHDYNIKSN
jgi:hypothetical protein